MSDHKAEIEKRKARLAAIRRDKADAAAAAAAAPNHSPHRGSPLAGVDSAEAILRELGIDVDAGSRATVATDQPYSSSPVEAAAAAPEGETVVSKQPPRPLPGRVLTLAHQVTQTSIPPRDCLPVFYCKETQTFHGERDRDVDSPRFLSTLEWDDEFNHQLSLSDALSSLEAGAGYPAVLSSAMDAEAAIAQLRANGLALAASIVVPPTPAPTPTSVGQSALQALPAAGSDRRHRELSDSERQQVLLSDGFQRFFQRAGRVMERALAENEAEDDDAEEDVEDDGYDEAADAGQSSVRVCRTFYDEKWSRGRCVTALDWSPHYQELCLAAYSEQQQPASNDTDGVVCVWNARYRCDSPEFALHCQSPVTSACFAAYQRCLLVGGTYSGQLVLWDTRTHRRSPVQRSPIGAQGHTQPCVFTRVVGTERASCLLSLCSDGRLCVWSVEMLSQPVETLDLALPAQLFSGGGGGAASGHRGVVATCMETLDANRFVLGAEDYRLGSGCRHGARAGLLEPLAAGHLAPVTSVSANPCPDLSHVILSSSFDWTARLSSLREPAEPPLALEAATDYVLDARWSPAHPGLLCTADGSGRLDFWSLGVDSEAPLARCQPMADGGLNRCCFNRTGCVLTAGDSLGRVALLELSEGLACPRPNEAQLVLRALQEARQARADARL